MITENSNRTSWVDICKAFAIYLMVLGHTGTSGNASIIIHAFHMPVFFILSGYCFNEVKNSNIIQLVKKRFKTLIIPYFVFGAGLFFVWDAALYLLHRKEEMRTISNLLSSILWNNANASAFGVIQWFLPCLFFSEIIFALFVTKISKEFFPIIGGVILISVVAYLYPIVVDVRLPWALDCALMASVFYGSGWLLKKAALVDKISNAFIRRHKLIAICVVIVFAVAALPLIFFNGAVNMRTITYGNYFLFIINAFLYSGLLIILSVLADMGMNGWLKRMLQMIGRNTLIILLLNSTCIRVWEVIFGNIVAKLNDNTVYFINVWIAALIVAVCVVISELVNRYVPWLIGKKKAVRERKGK